MPQNYYNFKHLISSKVCDKLICLDVWFKGIINSVGWWIKTCWDTAGPEELLGCCGAGEGLLRWLENAEGRQETTDGLWICRRETPDQCTEKKHHPTKRTSGLVHLPLLVALIVKLRGYFGDLWTKEMLNLFNLVLKYNYFFFFFSGNSR